MVMSNGALRADDPNTWTGALDRSPCGTGTCARMAALYARGELAIGEKFSHRSIIGSEFVGRADRHHDDRPVRRRAAHHHRQCVGDRLLALGTRRDRPLSRRVHGR